IRGESCAVHQAKRSREHRPVPRAPALCVRLSRDNQVLDGREHDGHRNQELDDRTRKMQRASYGKGKRYRVSHRKGSDHPERVPCVAQPIDGREDHEEENVIHCLDVDDVPEAKLDEREELTHWLSASWMAAA